VRVTKSRTPERGVVSYVPSKDHVLKLKMTKFRRQTFERGFFDLPDGGKGGEGGGSVFTRIPCSCPRAGKGKRIVWWQRKGEKPQRIGEEPPINVGKNQRGVMRAAGRHNNHGQVREDRPPKAPKTPPAEKKKTKGGPGREGPPLSFCFGTGTQIVTDRATTTPSRSGASKNGSIPSEIGDGRG